MFEEDLRKTIGDYLAANCSSNQVLKMAERKLNRAEARYQELCRSGAAGIEVLVASACYPTYEGVRDIQEGKGVDWPENYSEVWFTEDGLIKKGSYTDPRTKEEVVTGDDVLWEKGDFYSLAEAILDEEWFARVSAFSEDQYFERIDVAADIYEQEQAEMRSDLLQSEESTEDERALQIVTPLPLFLRKSAEQSDVKILDGSLIYTPDSEFAFFKVSDPVQHPEISDLIEGDIRQKLASMELPKKLRWDYFVDEVECQTISTADGPFVRIAYRALVQPVRNAAYYDAMAESNMKIDEFLS
jgi:hypothetical protein